MHICNEYFQVMGKDGVTYIDTYLLPDLSRAPNNLEDYLHSINLGSVDEICEELWENEQQRSQYLGLERSQRQNEHVRYVKEVLNSLSLIKIFSLCACLEDNAVCMSVGSQYDSILIIQIDSEVVCRCLTL